jgi:hypothetical protein
LKQRRFAQQRADIPKNCSGLRLQCWMASKRLDASQSPNVTAPEALMEVLRQILSR